jgi:hypothetical protein
MGGIIAAFRAGFIHYVTSLAHTEDLEARRTLLRRHKIRRCDTLST